MHRMYPIWLALAIACLFTGSPSFSTPRYGITDLGPASGISGIDARGTVLGRNESGAFTLFMSHGVRVPIRLSGEVLDSCGLGFVRTDLGESDGQMEYAGVISSNGDVAITLGFGEYDNCSVLYTNRKFTVVAGPGGSFFVSGLNRHDQLIGYEPTPIGSVGSGAACPALDPAFFYDPAAINDRGEVIADAFDMLDSTMDGAYLCHAGSWIPLGTLGGSTSATALSRSGRIVGVVTPNGGDTHAVEFIHGGIRDLGTLDNVPGSFSFATGVNDEHMIVGFAAPSLGAATAHPFLWFNHRMHDLNDLIDRRDPMARQVSFGGASMSSFDGPYINERGEIAVLGIDRRTGLQHAYRLRQVDCDRH